jgi:hypothetical protein
MSANDPQRQLFPMPESPYEAALKAALEEWESSGKISLADRALILTLAAKISPARRHILLHGIEEDLTAPTGRGGPVFENVIRLIDERPEWTGACIRRRLSEQGHPVDSKALSNCLNYMVKSGRLTRISRGRYAVAGFGVIASDQLVPEHDIPRGSENED